MHWHINFASALLGNSILCSLPRYTTVIDSSSSLILSFSCCTCCLFIFVLVFVMFSLIMSKKRFWNFSEPWLMHMWHRPKYWGPIVTHTWLVLDIQGIRHGHVPKWPICIGGRFNTRIEPQKVSFSAFLFSPGDVNRLSAHLASVKKKKTTVWDSRKLQLQILSGRREGTLLNFCWYSILAEERLSLEINTSPSLGHLHRTD